MLIKYVGGNTVRVWGEHIFKPSNQHEVEVTALDQVQEMLTQPGNDFAVSPNDPLAQLVGVDRAAELVLFESILTVDDYHAAHPTGAKQFIELRDDAGTGE